ncbi:hypothetical protein AALB39_28995 [Lachnospiraceae bacterium 54-53]
MKVRVSMPEASIAIDFEEGKALEVFGKLNEVLLAMKKKGKALTLEESAVHAETVIEPKAKAFPSQRISPPPVPALKEPEGLIASGSPKYKGFLHIKCPKCGQIKDFYMKKESDHYHCDGCGARTEFEKPLALLWVNCECGRRFRYLTNMTEPMFDIDCLDCGAPVAVKRNENRQVYETIR